MIKLSNVNKYYNKNRKNEIHVINNTSLDLPDSGLVTFLGASGSGKTTLLNVIGGLDKSTGYITYDSLETKNYNMSKIDKYRRENVGYVFQNYNLLNDLTVSDNLVVALEAIDIVDKDEVKKRVEYALKAVGMYKYRRKLAFALSGGQQQRVSIARALVKNSKIIIADEPTGNLDSENSIEVMRILKAISKNSLVLLVTHDKALAEYYSDTIIELKDGSIVDTRTRNNNASLDGVLSDNDVYLGDMQKHEGNLDLLKYELYTEEDDTEELSLKVIKKNGQYYISSNKPIKMLDQSPLKINEGKFSKEAVETKENEFVYDTSFFEDKKYNNFWKRLLRNILYSLKRFFFTRRRSKVFHVIFFLIGIVLGILNINILTYTTIDTDSLSYAEDYSKVVVEIYDEKALNLNRDIIKAYKDGAITSLAVRSDNFSYDLELNTIRKVSVNLSGYKACYEDVKDRNIIAGRAPKNLDEVVIGKKLADSILSEINEPKSTYETLLAGNLESYGSAFATYHVVGIVNVDSSFAYFKAYKDDIVALDSNMPNYKVGYKDYESNNYELITGSDISSSTSNECLISTSYLLNHKTLNIGDTIEIGINNNQNKDNLKKAFVISGAFEMKNENYCQYDFIVNDEEMVFPLSMSISRIALADKANYKLESGTDSLKHGECIASVYAGVELNSYIGGLKVVGLYSQNGVMKSDDPINTVYVSDNDMLLYPVYSSVFSTYYYGTEYYFKYDDINKVKDIIGDYEVVNSKTYAINNLHEINKIGKAAYIPVIIVLSVLILVYIYFTTRSSMLSDIYSIGVYRSLGYSRKRIASRYAVQIFIQTLFTSFIGYLISLGLYQAVANKLNKIGFKMVTVFDKPITYLLMLLFLGVSVLIGLIPVALLLMKTPSEITSKYDI